MKTNTSVQSKRVNELIDRSMANLSEMADANTVIGTPVITASGYQVIPVSKVTMGYLSGGSDIGETKIVKEGETVPFAGGSGAVVSVRPAGFILDDGKSCRYIHAGDDPIDNLIDKTSDLLNSLRRDNG